MKVLLVEDDEKVASFVVKGFREALIATVHVTTAEEAHDWLQSSSFDVLVLDLMLPGMDGLTFLEKLRSEGVTTPILILSAKQSVDDRVTGLRKGGDDYLTKPFSFSELLARVHAISRRSKGTLPEEHLLMEGDLRLDLFSREAFRGSVKIPLQTKEFELLEYLMRRKGRVVSKTMIIENVWKYSFDPQTNIVEVRMSRLRDKVDKPFATKLIHTIRGAGYRLRAEEPSA
jgi:two-component system OmpR family response regulator